MMMVVVVVVVVVVVMVMMTMVVTGAMGMARFPQQPGAQQIDHQTDNGDHHGFAIVDGTGIEQAHRGFPQHGGCDRRQNQCAGVGSQDLNLPGAEGKAMIPGKTA